MLSLVAMVVLVSSCGDSALEERVSKLEQRLSKVENPSAAQAMENSAQPVANSQPSGPAPAFEFEEEEFDFGTINEGDVVNHTFKFTNTGEAPLVIQSASASCGCTVPSYPKEPIAVGESGEIQVQFNSKNKSGQQSPNVTITANTEPNVSRLRIKGVVVNDNANKAASVGGPVRK